MKLSIASADDLFIRRKCGACKRLALPGQAVFSSFCSALEDGNAWLVFHLGCLQVGDETIGNLIEKLATDLDRTMGATDQNVIDYHTLREQIIRTKEAFPNAAA